MATSPFNSIMQDPAFAMFVSAAGLQDELALADAARRRTAINQALGIQEEQIAEAGKSQREGIAGDQESRGVFRSGQTLKRTAESERSQARASALAQLEAANQLGDVESNLLTGQVNRQFDIASKALGSAEGLSLEQGESDIDARLKALSEMGTSPLTGLSEVSPLAPNPAPAPALPVAGVGVERRTNLTNKYKRAF